MIQPIPQAFTGPLSVATARSCGVARFGGSEAPQSPDASQPEQTESCGCNPLSVLCGWIHKLTGSDGSKTQAPAQAQAESASPPEQPNILRILAGGVEQYGFNRQQLEAIRRELTPELVRERLDVILAHPENTGVLDRWFTWHWPTETEKSYKNKTYWKGDHKVNEAYVKLTPEASAMLKERIAGRLCADLQAQLDGYIDELQQDKDKSMVSDTQMAPFLQLFGLSGKQAGPGPGEPVTSVYRMDKVIQNNVCDIFKHLDPSEYDKLIVDGYQPVIKGQPVGTVTVKDRQTGQPVTMQVTAERNITIETGFNPFARGPKELKGDLLRIYRDNEEMGYTLLEKKTGWDNADQVLDDGGKSHIYVHYMRSTHGNDRYKGLGEALHQIAIEESFLQGCEGRIQFESEQDPLPFHLMNGFRFVEIRMQDGFIMGRSENERAEQAIAEAREKNQRLQFSTFQSMPVMYLPSEQIARWRDIIAENPILDGIKAMLKDGKPPKVA